MVRESGSVRLGMTTEISQSGANNLQKDKRNSVTLMTLSFCGAHYDIFANIDKNLFDVIYLIHGETHLPSDLSIFEFWPHAKTTHMLYR